MQNYKLFKILIAFLIVLLIVPVNVSAAKKAPEGTRIGITPIGNLTDAQIEMGLAADIAVWQAGEPILVKSEFEQFTVERSVFHFEIDEAIRSYKEQTKRKITKFFMRPKNKQININVTLDETHEDIVALTEKDYLDFAAIEKKLVDYASQFQNGSLEIVYLDEASIPLETVAKASLKNESDLSNAAIEHVVEKLNNYEIPARSSFSLLESMDLSQNILSFSDELSFIGSTLYKVFLKTDFTIIERYANQRQPAYTKAGLDVVINYDENKDFKIINESDQGYVIKVKYKNDKLSISLQGKKTSLTYKYEVENYREINQRTIYRYSKEVHPGEQHTILAGEKGVTVQVERSTYDNGIYLDSEIISHDVYLPKPTIIVRSPEDKPQEDDKENDVDDKENQFQLTEKDFDALIGALVLAGLLGELDDEDGSEENSDAEKDDEQAEDDVETDEKSNDEAAKSELMDKVREDFKDIFTTTKDKE